MGTTQDMRPLRGWSELWSLMGPAKLRWSVGAAGRCPFSYPVLRMFTLYMLLSLPLPPGLLSSCTHCSACMMRAAQGCLRYLDMQPNGIPLPLAPLAWDCLSASLCGLAEQFLSSRQDEGEQHKGRGCQL